MTSTHSGYIAAKNAERGMLATAVEHFLRSGGTIELAGNTAPVATIKGSLRSTEDNAKDALIAERIRQQIALGAGVRAIRHDLNLGSATVRRICSKYKLTISRAQRAPATTEMISAQQARRDELLKKPVAIIKEMALTGSTVDEMATAANVSRSSVMRWIREHGIERGPKMDLSV